MNAPKRWLEEGGGATAGERDLLRSGIAMDPPEGARAAVWSAILAGLPPAGAAGAAGGAGKAAAGSKAAAGARAAVAAKTAGSGAVAVGTGILKSALIGAGCGVVVVATYSVVSPSPPEPRPAPALTAPARDPLPASGRRAGEGVPAAPDPSAAASAEAPTEHPADEARAPAAGATASVGSDVASAPERETMLREESRLVGEASAALRGGDASGALVMLDRIAARFPRGGLGLEREALSIEALYKSGRRAEASARAAAFLKANPDSTLATRVQPFAN